jgi:hypothetical protein
LTFVIAGTRILETRMANVHNAGKLKFEAKEKRKKRRKNVFQQLNTLEIGANGPREHI